MRRILLLLTTLCLASLVHAAPSILVFGDSLSAGYGIARQAAWPSLLETRLKDSGYSHTVVNASISGETTAGGRSRLPAALKQHQPRIVIIELGANDGLRGLPVASMRDNLNAMIRSSQQAGARVMLVGMRIPPNYGRDYTEKFSATFTELAKEHKTALVPFLFEGFALRADAFQADRLHPTAASQPLMLDTIWKQLQPLLR
ncbi:MAG TPA: arylesterase [Rhodocyclaceae bacterium]|nr:arylesterase [Rhodocyclaceae bacterium]